MIPVWTMRTVENLAPTLASCLAEVDHGGFAAWTLTLSDGGRIVLGGRKLRWQSRLRCPQPQEPSTQLEVVGSLGVVIAAVVATVGKAFG